MNSQAAPDYFELRDYTSVLRRRWMSIAAVTLAGTALAGAYVVLGPKTYTGTVLMQVSALPNNANAVGGRTGGQVNMDNEAQAVRSAAVAALVKSALRSPMSLTEISRNINVAVPPNTTFLQISCAASSAIGAEKCANAVGQAYLDARRVGIEKALSSTIMALQKQARRLRGSIERLKLLVYTTRHKKGVISGSPVVENDALQLSAAQTAMMSVQAHIDSALPLYASLAVPGSPVVGTIASKATLPTAPSSPRKLLYVPSGLIGGLLVGIGVSFIAERRRKRVHSARDIERFCGLPALVSLTQRGHPKVVGLESPRTAAGRAFGELAHYVGASLGDSGRVLAVAATSPGANGSVVAANLAAAMARTIDQTILVCADLHGTRAPELLGVSRGPGLADVFTSAANAADVLSSVGDLPRLRVVTPGFEIAAASAAIQQATMKHLISDLLDDARYVVIEVQSVGENSDTFGLARFAEAAIVAVELERSRQDDITDCVRRLDRLGTRVLGTAVVPVVPIIRKSRSAEPPPDRGYAGSIKRYEVKRERGSATSASDSAAPILSPGSAMTWTERPDFTMSPVARSITEAMAQPWQGPRDFEGHPNSADPATGD